MTAKLKNAVELLMILIFIIITVLLLLLIAGPSNKTGSCECGCGDKVCQCINCPKCNTGSCECGCGIGDCQCSNCSKCSCNIIGSAEKRKTASGESKMLLTKLVKDGDKNEIASFLGKACNSGDDTTAAELLALRGDIITLLSGSPGLIEYVDSLPEARHAEVQTVLECIKNSIAGTKIGGSPIFEVSEDITEKQVYDYIKPYITEIGTSKYIEEYLQQFSSQKITNKTIKKEVQTNKIIKHKVLYSLIENIIEQHYIKTIDDFIIKTKLKYTNFLPKPKQKLLELADKYEIDIVDDLHAELKSRISHIRDQDIDNLLRKLESSLAIYKFSPGYSKKARTAIVKAKAKAFRVDYVAVMPVMDALADAVNIGQISKIFDNIYALGFHTPSASEERSIREYISQLTRNVPERENKISLLLRAKPELIDMTKYELENLRNKINWILGLSPSLERNDIINAINDAVRKRDSDKIEELLEKIKKLQEKTSPIEPIEHVEPEPVESEPVEPLKPEPAESSEPEHIESSEPEVSELPEPVPIAEVNLSNPPESLNIVDIGITEPVEPAQPELENPENKDNII